MAPCRTLTRRLPPRHLLAALLAALVHLALGGAVPGGPSPAELAALDAASILCTGAPPADHGHHHHPPAPALCPAATGLAQPAALPDPAPGPVPPGTAVAPWRGERPPGRGPPPASARVGRPRAPPPLA